MRAAEPFILAPGPRRLRLKNITSSIDTAAFMQRLKEVLTSGVPGQPAEVADVARMLDAMGASTWPAGSPVRIGDSIKFRSLSTYSHRPDVLRALHVRGRRPCARRNTS
jgi:hypothetical protein